MGSHKSGHIVLEQIPLSVIQSMQWSFGNRRTARRDVIFADAADKLKMGDVHTLSSLSGRVVHDGRPFLAHNTTGDLFSILMSRKEEKRGSSSFYVIRSVRPLMKKRALNRHIKALEHEERVRRGGLNNIVKFTPEEQEASP